MKDKNILIRNIYHMLAYAYAPLKATEYTKVKVEDFDDAYDLLGQILSIGVISQIKAGLYREYIPIREELPTVKGRIDLKGTMDLENKSLKRTSCDFDFYSEDNQFNRVIKTTIKVLLHRKEVVNSRQQLNRLYHMMEDIQTVDPYTIQWRSMNYHRNNSTYRMLINFCYLIISSLIMTEDEGEFKLESFFTEKKMHRIFEDFVRNYYTKHHGTITRRSTEVKWLLDEGDSGNLPHMYTDTTLVYGDRTLIIDTKYYQSTLQTRDYGYGEHSSYISQNLYQLFAYVKNSDTKKDGTVSGMLLYAKTESKGPFDEEYILSGNRIVLRTIDLNKPFEEITKVLEDNLRYLRG